MDSLAIIVVLGAALASVVVYAVVGPCHSSGVEPLVNMSIKPRTWWHRHRSSWRVSPGFQGVNGRSQVHVFTRTGHFTVLHGEVEDIAHDGGGVV